MRKPILAVLFFLAFQLSVFAQHPDSGWMHSYTAETTDKKYIFVLRRDNEPDFFVGSKYKQSGMYLNDGSMDPLWTIDWRQRVYLPDDGKHVVRVGKLLYSSSYREEVFAFISEGNVRKTYQTRDLIAFPYLLPHSSAGYYVNNSTLSVGTETDGVLMKIDQGDGYTLNGGVTIDNERQTIFIETLHGDEYLFDLETGNIISSRRPTRNLAFALFGVVIFSYAAYLFFAQRVKVSQTALRIANAVIGFLLTLFLFLIPVVAVSVYKIPFYLFRQVLPDYPDFWTCIYLSVTMLPRYLLVSLNFVSYPTNNVLFTDYETLLSWLGLFWLPCILIFAVLTHFIVLLLKSKRRRLC